MHDQEEAVETSGSDDQACGNCGQERLTIQQAVDHIGLGKSQAKMALVLCLAMSGEGMQLGILPILPAMLRCEWQLQTWQEAFISTVVFCGALVGGIFWGKMADVHGRRTVVIFTSAVTLYFGLLSALAPSFAWMIITRALVGFAVSCAPLMTTLVSEFLPIKHRAICLILLTSLWPVFSFLTVALALFVVPALGWRYLLGISIIPLLFFCCCSPWLPESPRFCLTRGRVQEAFGALRRMAAENGRAMPCESLEIPTRYSHERGGLRDIFSKDLRVTIAVLSCVWFVTVGFILVGIALLTTSLLSKPDGCHVDEVANQSTAETCFASCRRLTPADYRDLLITYAADLPGSVVALVTASRLGRRRSYAMLASAFSLAVLLLNLCPSRAWLVALLCLCRGSAMGTMHVVMLYSVEAFPTSVRALAQGFLNSMARTGALITPFVAQVLVTSSPHLAISIYGVSAVLAVPLFLLFLSETKGRPLKDTLGDAN